MMLFCCIVVYRCYCVVVVVVDVIIVVVVVDVIIVVVVVDVIIVIVVVDALKAGDIDIVAALGDSLTAANGAGASGILGILFEWRGISWR